MKIHQVPKGVHELKPLSWGGDRLLLCLEDVELHLPPMAIGRMASWEVWPAGGRVKIICHAGASLSDGQVKVSEVVLAEQRIHRIAGTAGGYVTDFALSDGAPTVKKAKAVKGSDEE